MLRSASWLDNLLAQSWGDYLTWAVMLLMLGVMVYFFRRQDRAYATRALDPTAEEQRDLLALLVARGRILCLLWTLLLLTLVIDAVQHPSRPSAAMAEAAIAPAATSATPNSVTLSADGAAVLSEVPAMARTALIDRIKDFYQDAFVAYYYLNKCGAGNDADNKSLYGAMIEELGRQGAASEASKVMDASRGSFEVIYSDSPCDAKYLGPIKSRFEAMMLALPTRLKTVSP